MRLWYQSFTDPDSDRAYFDRLVEFVRGVASPGVAVDVYGIRPGDHDLHPVTELRGSLTTLRAALRAKAEGYDAVVIGHFQEPGLDIVRAAILNGLPVVIEAAQTAVRLRTKYGVAPARVGTYQPPTANALDQLLGSLSENSGII